LCACSKPGPKFQTLWYILWSFFMFNDLRWVARIKLDRDPVAKDYWNLTWTPVNNYHDKTHFILIESLHAQMHIKSFVYFVKSDHVTQFNCHNKRPTVCVNKFIILAGLSERGGTRYFYPPKMVFGTSWF